MKKLISIAVCATMMLSMAACSSSKEPKTSAPAQQEAQQAEGEASEAAAQWPTKNIDLIVPFKAGGDTDFYARTYAKYLGKELGVTVTVINVEGSGGTVGAQQIKDSKNDGSKVLFYHTGNLFVNKLLGVTEIDHNDFEVAAIGILDDTNTVFAGKDSGITSAEDLFEKAKANPSSINVATTISGFSYYTVCKAEAVGGFKLNAVDVGGSSAMVPAVLGNQTELAANSYGVFKQYVESGDVIPLFTYSEERNPSFPDVPTAKEVGLDNCTAVRAYFFGLPKGTDAGIVKLLSDAVGNIQSNEEYASDIRTAYMVEPFYLGADETQAYLDEVWTDMEQYKGSLTSNK